MLTIGRLTQSCIKTARIRAPETGGNDVLCIHVRIKTSPIYILLCHSDRIAKAHYLVGLV